jgi:hypothetical protein
VKPSADLVREGWFGPGEAHPRFAERVGDVALVMNGRYTCEGLARRRAAPPAHRQPRRADRRRDDDSLIVETA